MVIQDLEYVLKIAEYGSISKAAELLYRSYQGVHQTLEKVEQELGRCLFTRNRGKMELTDFGKFALETFVKPAAHMWNELENSSNTFDEYEENSLKIGVESPYGLYQRPAEYFLLGKRKSMEFAEINRKYNVQIFEQSLQENERMIRDGELDIGLGFVNKIPEGLKHSRIYCNECSFFASAYYRDSNGGVITEDKLKKASIWLYSDKSIFGQFVIENERISEEQVLLALPDNEFARRLYNEGRLIRIGLEEKADVDSGELKLSPQIPMYFKLAFLYSDERQMKPALRDFLEFLEKEETGDDR